MKKSDIILGASVLLPLCLSSGGSRNQLDRMQALKYDKIYSLVFTPKVMSLVQNGTFERMSMKQRIQIVMASSPGTSGAVLAESSNPFFSIYEILTGATKGNVLFQDISQYYKLNKPLSHYKMNWTNNIIAPKTLALIDKKQSNGWLNLSPSPLRDKCKPKAYVTIWVEPTAEGFAQYARLIKNAFAPIIKETKVGLKMTGTFKATMHHFDTVVMYGPIQKLEQAVMSLNKLDIPHIKVLTPKERLQLYSKGTFGVDLDIQGWSTDTALLSLFIVYELLNKNSIRVDSILQNWANMSIEEKCAFGDLTMNGTVFPERY